MLRRLFKGYQSAGKRVSATAYRLIREADCARDASDWSRAAALYERVLESRPDLVHLRIQRGHALKESGRWETAIAEYRQALSTTPEDRDASLHLAHMLKLTGDSLAAAELYLSLALRDGDDEEAMREARNLLGNLAAGDRSRMVSALHGHLTTPEQASGHPYPARHFARLGECEIAFDTSDLISFFSHSRRPTGIQRVQIEVLKEALGADTAISAGVCCFIDGLDRWVEVPAAPLLRLLALSGAAQGGDQRQWRQARDALHLGLLVAKPVDFRPGATLVNLGTSWWLRNYFLALRDMQARRGIVYVPMIHDMIPIVLPELCLQPLVRDFVAWAQGIFTHSATFLANSEATKRDLIACAARLDHLLDPAAIKVVPLDALPPSSDVAEEPDAMVLRKAMVDGPFVLFVATFEPRKGHITAFEAWEQLVVRLGAERTPRLVCVGRAGWHSEPIYARLAASASLRDKVTLFADLDEATLASLYARCAFSIYPSLYEGWGLPVTEALARGAPVITTTSSSLPEAGGAFAIYVAAGDTDALACAAERLIVDPTARDRLTEWIEQDFRPSSWRDIARSLAREAAALGSLPAPSPMRRPPCAALEHFHWIGRSMAMRLRPEAENGEGYRAGLGWGPLEEWGCNVAEEGALIRFSLAPDHGAQTDLLAGVRIVAPPSGCPFRVGPLSGQLAAGERRTIFFPVRPDADNVVAIEIAGVAASGTAQNDEPLRKRTLGVEGFAVHRRRPGDDRFLPTAGD